MRFFFPRVIILGLLFFIGSPAGLFAQDIELLGRIHGTRPPQGYFDLQERDPGAFQFRRALFRRGLGLRELPEVGTAGRSIPATYDRAFARLLAQSPERAPMAGTFNFPFQKSCVRRNLLPLSPQCLYQTDFGGQKTGLRRVYERALHRSLCGRFRYEL